MSGIKIGHGHGNPNIQTDVALWLAHWLALIYMKEKYFVLFLNKVCV